MKRERIVEFAAPVFGEQKVQKIRRWIDTFGPLMEVTGLQPVL